MIKIIRPKFTARAHGRAPLSWVIALSLCLSGCTVFQPAGTPEEPPLTPLSGADRPMNPGQTGQQEASLQLTDQGRQHLASGRIEEAISLFQKAISLFPKNPYAYYYLAQARYLRQEYIQSLTPLGQAELFLSDDRIWLSRVYALRGRIDESLSRLEEARSQYQKALTSDPGNAEAREGLERLDHPPTPND